MAAFAAENIAPTVTGLDFSPSIIKALLARSYCRRCGKCCSPETETASQSGVMVYEDELKRIARHSRFSYKYLKKRSTRYKNTGGEDVRWFHLPCMFYEKGGCQIHEIRPFVCRTYPVVASPQADGRTCVSIILKCDYGKDIYRSIVSDFKKAGQASS
jgi:Fe-S-cluster containining protein